MRTVVTIEGLRELDRALGQLPKATGKNVLRRVLRTVGEPIAEAGAANAPVREGHLRESYGVGTKLTRRQAKLHKKMFKNDRASVEMFVGPNDPSAVQTEFGNEHQAAEPHLRPAWDAGKGPALESIKAELWSEIDKAAKRLARKAARGR